MNTSKRTVLVACSVVSFAVLPVCLHDTGSRASATPLEPKSTATSSVTPPVDVVPTPVPSAEPDPVPPVDSAPPPSEDPLPAPTGTPAPPQDPVTPVEPVPPADPTPTYPEEPVPTPPEAPAPPEEPAPPTDPAPNPPTDPVVPPTETPDPLEKPVPTPTETPIPPTDPIPNPPVPVPPPSETPYPPEEPVPTPTERPTNPAPPSESPQPPSDVRPAPSLAPTQPQPANPAPAVPTAPSATQNPVPVPPNQPNPVQAGSTIAHLLRPENNQPAMVAVAPVPPWQVVGAEAPSTTTDAGMSRAGRPPVAGSVLGLTNTPQQSYNGTPDWVEGFLNSNNQKNRTDSSNDSNQAAGVLGAEAQGHQLEPIGGSNAFQRGMSIVTGARPLLMFSGIAVVGLALVVFNFVWRNRTPRA